MSSKPATTLLAKPVFEPLPGVAHGRHGLPPIPRDVIRALRVRPQSWARIGTATYSSVTPAWTKRLHKFGFTDIELAIRSDASGVRHIYARSNGKFED